MTNYLSLLACCLVFHLQGMELKLPEAQTSRQKLINAYLIACSIGDTDTAVLALKNNDDALRFTEQSDCNGQTGLMLAAGNGHAKTIETILSYHMNYERLLKDSQRNYTAREWAEYHDWEQCAHLLP